MSAADDVPVPAPSPVEGKEAVPAAPPEPVRLGFGERLSDRLNPILVRETQQALGGRMFLAALAIALTAIVLVALAAASGDQGTRERGWSAFVLGLRVLAPILFLVVPMQAFLSMRQEVTAGTIEHLLLSRLTPAAVVRGKLAAALVEAMLFFSVFAPLLALTYLLRGVDVPTIGTALLLAFVYSAAASTFAIAMGALSRSSGFRALPLIFMALALTVGTVIVTSTMPYLVYGAMRLARDEEMGGAVGVLLVTVPALVVTPLFFLVAASSLAHPYENRTTAFRAYAIGGLLALAGWAAWMTERKGAHLGLSAEVVPTLCALGAAFTAPFWLFAVTEETPLSPRVRTLVPRRAVLALLAAPFLPGGGRGMLFTTVLAVAALAAASLFPRWFGDVAPGNTEYAVLVVAWSYALIYASLARLARVLLPPGPRWTTVCRVAFPVFALLLAFLPTIVVVLSDRRGSARESGLVYLVDPAAILDGVDRGANPTAAFVVRVLGALAVLVQVPAMLRGVIEVLGASKERRQREA